MRSFRIRRGLTPRARDCPGRAHRPTGHLAVRLATDWVMLRWPKEIWMTTAGGTASWSRTPNVRRLPCPTRLSGCPPTPRWRHDPEHVHRHVAGSPCRGVRSVYRSRRVRSAATAVWDRVGLEADGYADLRMVGTGRLWDRHGWGRAVLIAALAAVTFPGVGAFAWEGPPVAGVRVERMLTAVVTVRLDGPVIVGEAGGFERRVDPSGRVLSETALAPGIDLPATPLGDFGCAPDGTRPGFVDHSETGGPVRLGIDVPGGSSSAVFHAYTLEGARRGVGDRTTVQALFCLAGGAQATDGWRLLQAGVGVAYDSREESFLLGKRWLDGSAPAVGEDTYRFGSAHEVGARGRIRQEPRGIVEGSFIGPIESDFDEYFRNGLAGWWQDGCVDDAAACLQTDGSEQFQGSLAGGLWEFFADEIPDGGLRFRVASFSVFSCAPPSASCTAPGRAGGRATS